MISYLNANDPVAKSAALIHLIHLMSQIEDTSSGTSGHPLPSPILLKT